MAILNFIKPDKVFMIGSTEKEGQFEFRPLEPGYGLTIGNALRRVLLSSLEGFAISSIKIDSANVDQDAVDNFHAAMHDDLNTPEALSILFKLTKQINSSSDSEEQMKYAATLKELSGILGLLQDDPKTFFQFGAILSDKEIEHQIQLRNEARDSKDFKTADKIRDALEAQGILLDDGSQGTTWKKS